MVAPAGESLLPPAAPAPNKAAPTAAIPSVLLLPAPPPPSKDEPAAVNPPTPAPIAAMLDSLLAAILAALLAPNPANVVGVGAMLARLAPAELLLISFLGLFLAL